MTPRVRLEVVVIERDRHAKHVLGVGYDPAVAFAPLRAALDDDSAEQFDPTVICP